jgi:hypothetical protein
VIALGAGLAWRLARRPRSPAFHKVVSGSVLVEGSPRDRLRTGEAVRIAGSAPAVVHLADGSRAELDPASEAVLAGRAGRARQVIALDRGGGRFTVRPGAGEFRVETPLGSVTALGTQFTVRLVRGERKEGDRRRSLAVAVAEGSVRVDAAAKSRTLAAGQSCLVAGEEFRADEGRTVRGTVLLVDGARGALVLVSGGDRPRRYDLGLAPQAEVLSDGRPAGIEAIQPGVQVLCRLSADGRTAVSLQAVGPVVAGTIAQVDAAARTVTLASGEDGRQRRTLPVAAGAVVLIHGRPGQLADLRPGVRPAVQLSVDGRTVLEIRVGRPRTEGRAPSAEREVRSGE